VPSEAAVEDLGAEGEKIGGRQPFAFINGAAGQLSDLSNPGSSCYAFGVDFPEPLGHIDGPDSCTPDPVTGALQTFRPVLLVAMYVACFAPLAWWAWRTYAPGSTGVA
jgi:hypothetical protein